MVSVPIRDISLMFANIKYFIHNVQLYMFVSVYLSKMHNCYHKENMFNSFYIRKR